MGKGVIPNRRGKGRRKIDSEKGHHQQIKLFGKCRATVAKAASSLTSTTTAPTFNMKNKSPVTHLTSH